MAQQNRRPTPPRYAPSPRRLLPGFQLRPQWWNWTGLYRALDERIARHGTDRLGARSVRGLRYFWLDGIFASLSDNILVSFVAVFLLAYGATNGQIGALNAVANLFGVLALFPGAAHADRVRNPKALVLWTGGGLGRLAVLGLVVVPFIAPSATVAIWIAIGINAFRSFMGNYANPAWTSIVADLVPNHRRGRYFSERNFTMGIAALIVASGGGLLIRSLNGRFDLPFLGYQAVFALALFFGLLSTFSFLRIPLRPRRVEAKLPRPSGLLRIVTAHPEFGAFLLGAFIWNLSIQMAAPFFNVFLVTELGGTVQTVGLTSGVMSVLGLFGQIFFGRLLDRRGALTVIAISGLIIPLLPIGWGLATQVRHVYVLVSVGGAAWAGYNLANFNLLLDLAPAEARNRAVALYQAVVFAAAVVGPIAAADGRVPLRVPDAAPQIAS
ncbi:MAG: MFS transporter [Spirochaetota bacterium]